MIKYSMGSWGLRFIFRFRGSVFPKAFVVASVATALTALLHHYGVKGRDEIVSEGLVQMEGFEMVWAGYTSVLSFLLVFRNNQAYTRFWEGATLVNQIRGEWFNSVSSLFAFCNQDPKFAPRVQEFQHSLVRLASLLYCSALQQICELHDDCFDVLDYEGMSKESIGFMNMSNDRCLVIMQWMQRLMVDAHEAHVLNVPSPLLTRALQELSRGIVNLNNARKIQEIPFPFPYAQLITCMLLVHGLATPVIASRHIASVAVASLSTFLLTFVLWCLVFTTMEIDQPFGDDPNDLPLYDMQREFNESLITLMHPLAQKVPEYARPESVSAISSTNTASSSLRMSMTMALDALQGMDAMEVASSNTPMATITPLAALAKDVSVTSPSLRGPPLRKSRWSFCCSENGSNPDSPPTARRRSWADALEFISTSTPNRDDDDADHDDDGGDDDRALEDIESVRDWVSVRDRNDRPSTSRNSAAPGRKAPRFGRGNAMAATFTSGSRRTDKGCGGGSVRSADAAKEETPDTAGDAALTVEGSARGSRRTVEFAEDEPSVYGRSPTNSSGSDESLTQNETPLPAELGGRGGNMEAPRLERAYL